MTWFNGRRIVVPFDFTDECADAVKVAVDLALEGDDVHVLHVVPDLPVNQPYVIWDENVDEQRRASARQAMEKQLDGLGAGHLHLDVGIGNPGTTVVKMAEEIGAGLIVVPSHGRRGLSRLMLGSVAERIVRLASCPVLVLKPQGN